MYDDMVEKKYRFHPLDVFNAKLKGVQSGAKIGLWLDLTKTKRYYSKKEVYYSLQIFFMLNDNSCSLFLVQVEKKDCLYKKLPMKGHGATPSEEETESFCSEVSAFLKVMGT